MYGASIRFEKRADVFESIQPDGFAGMVKGIRSAFISYDFVVAPASQALFAIAFAAVHVHTNTVRVRRFACPSGGGDFFFLSDPSTSSSLSNDLLRPADASFCFRFVTDRKRRSILPLT
jgi:hypothetical protein